MSQNNIKWLGKEKLENLMSPLSTTAFLKGNKPDNIIIAMHGFGDTAANFSSLGHEISLNNILWLFPQGPKNVNIGMSGNQWYPLFSNPKEERKSSENLIFQLCNNIVEKLQIPMEKIFILGFSQGASMALSCGLKIKKRVAGIIALSGFIVQQFEIQANLSHKDIPIFLAHGLQDQVVFPTSFYESNSALNHIGMTKVISKTYLIGHTISHEEIADIKKFIEDYRS